MGHRAWDRRHTRAGGDRFTIARSRGRAVYIGLVVTAMASLGLPSATSMASTSAGVPKGKTLGWGFDEPTAIASDDQDVFVANGGGNTVTELALPTFARARVIHGPEYHFAE